MLESKYITHHSEILWSIILRVRDDPLPEPVLLPQEYDLFNWNSFGFGKKNVNKEGHDGNPASKE